MTWFLSRFKQEEWNMKFLIWLSSVFATVGLFLMGTIFVLGVGDTLWIFIIGVLINGLAGALALNNGVAAIVEHLRLKFPGAGESVNNITSGVFVFFFSLGEMLGPIFGSVFVAYTGSFSKGVALINIMMLLWAILTIYHLGGSLLCKSVPKAESVDYNLFNEEETKTTQSM